MRNNSSLTMAARKNSKNRQQQKSPARPAPSDNQPLNQSFSTKKINQSSLPNRRVNDALQSKDKLNEESNYYHALESTMEIDNKVIEDANNPSEGTVDANNTLDVTEDANNLSEHYNHQSDDTSSDDSSGIIHPVIPGNSTTMVDSENNQDNGITTPHHTQVPIDEQSVEESTTVHNNPRLIQNPYRQPARTFQGRGGGIIRNAARQDGLSPTRTSAGATIHQAVRSAPKNYGWDYDIKLKRGIVCHNTTRYDLRFKVKSTNTEEESQVAIHRLLTDFFNVILQADNTTILPPYLDLDRNSVGTSYVQRHRRTSDAVSK
jgi:hypothetical protein